MVSPVRLSVIMMLSATVLSLLPDRAGLRPWVGPAAAVGSGVLVDVRILVLSTKVPGRRSTCRRREYSKNC